MAKIAFTKLGLKQNTEIKTINFNDQVIEVKQYLPVNDKLKIISTIINSSAEEDINFANPIKVDVYGTLEIIYAYTNITFTDKQKEDAAKLYDLLDSSGLIDAVVAAIPTEEYEFLIDGIDRSIDSLYSYKNSMVGLMEAVTQDYSALDLDASNIQKSMADPQNMALLKDVLAKLG